MRTANPRTPFHRALLSSATAAVLALTLSACGGSDEGGESDSQSSTGSSGTETKSSATAKALPEGFPADVPLPAHQEIKSASTLSEGTWRVMFLVDIDEEGSVEAYAAQLADAGFEVDTSSVIVSGKNDSWSVDAVIRPPTITLQVITRSGQ